MDSTRDPGCMEEDAYEAVGEDDTVKVSDKVIGEDEQDKNESSNEFYEKNQDLGGGKSVGEDDKSPFVEDFPPKSQTTPPPTSAPQPCLSILRLEVPAF